MRSAGSRSDGTLRLWLLATLAVAVILMMAEILVLTVPPRRGLFQESGLVERASILAWILNTVLGIVMFLRWRGRLDRVGAVCLTLVATLALLRECDLHTVLTARGAMGEWGVRFKINWWLSSSAPVWPRIIWGLLGVALGSVLIGSALRYRGVAWRLLRGRDAAAVMLAASVILLFSGYLFDDQLGRGRLVQVGTGKAIEESAEFLGALAFGAGLMLLLTSPPSMRLSALDGRDARSNPP